MIRIRTAPFAAFALLLCALPTAAERGACMGDAISLCLAAIPNKARIASCLASKMSQLSPRCRSQFEKAAISRQ
jgi:hypothetical protein